MEKYWEYVNERITTGVNVANGYIAAHPEEALGWLLSAALLIVVLMLSKVTFTINWKRSVKGQGQMDNPHDLTAEQLTKKQRRLAIKERKLWARKRIAMIVDKALAEEWGKEDPATGWSLSLAELKEFHGQIARSTGCYDLMPKRLVVYPSKDVLKKDLLARKELMEENRAHKRADLYDPVPLPDTGIRAKVQAVIQLPRKARNSMEEFLFSSRKAS